MVRTWKWVCTSSGCAHTRHIAARPASSSTWTYAITLVVHDSTRDWIAAGCWQGVDACPAEVAQLGPLPAVVHRCQQQQATISRRWLLATSATAPANARRPPADHPVARARRRRPARRRRRSAAARRPPPGGGPQSARTRPRRCSPGFDFEVSICAKLCLMAAARVPAARRDAHPAHDLLQSEVQCLKIYCSSSMLPRAQLSVLNNIDMHVPQQVQVLRKYHPSSLGGCCAAPCRMALRWISDRILSFSGIWA